MMKFLGDVLDSVLEGINEKIEGTLRKAFEAGQSFESEAGPDFETWLAEERARVRNQKEN
jgi:hypothetical protein